MVQLLRVHIGAAVRSDGLETVDVAFRIRTDHDVCKRVMTRASFHDCTSHAAAVSVLYYNLDPRSSNRNYYSVI